MKDLERSMLQKVFYMLIFLKIYKYKKERNGRYKREPNGTSRDERC